MTAVEAEAGWLNGDPAVTTKVGQVLAYQRREAVKEPWAVLTRVSYVRVGRDTAFEERIHAFRLSVPWLAESAAFDLAQAQHDLDEAVAALDARICDQDRTHGGLWFTSGTEGTFSGLGASGLAVQFEDAANALDATADGRLSCSMTWTVTERIPRDPYA